jgi:N-acetylmuramoyl-L-alanine amidase
MAYVFKKRIANRANYGYKRVLSRIKYIVVHYTANDGDSDEGNGNYFANHIIEASAHYFVDGDSITQSVPDDYVAYSVGGKKYTDCNKTGGGKF